MYGALILKELRLLRPVIITVLLVAMFCEVVIPAISVYERSVRRGSMPMSQVKAGLSQVNAELWQDLQGGAIIATVLSCGLAAAFACAPATTERRERWAELSAMLPISTAQKTFVRLAIAATLAAIVVSFHTTLIYLAGEQMPTNWRISHVDLERYARMAVAIFSFAWLCAAFSRSPVLAAAIAIGLVLGSLMIFLAYQGIVYARGENGGALEQRYYAGLIIASLAALLTGTVHAIRRVEP